MGPWALDAALACACRQPGQVTLAHHLQVLGRERDAVAVQRCDADLRPYAYGISRQDLSLSHIIIKPPRGVARVLSHEWQLEPTRPLKIHLA